MIWGTDYDSEFRGLAWPDPSALPFPTPLDRGPRWSPQFGGVSYYVTREIAKAAASICRFFSVFICFVTGLAAIAIAPVIDHR